MRLTALILVFAIALCGCGGKTQEVAKTPELRACWVSYLELNFPDKSKENFTNEIEKMCGNIKNIGLNCVFVHTISHCDAYYNSNVLPLSKYIAGTRGGKLDYDPLKIICNTAKKFGLQVHAWINPFRILQGSADLSQFQDDDIAKKMINSKDATVLQDGVYLLPTSQNATRLMLDAIREIVSGYDIDGVHFDDYFYPTTNENFDKENYLSYKNSVTNPLSLDDYRRTAVSQFVSAVYRIVKGKDDNLKFGISPQADIQKNRNNLYADIEKWCADDGYIDYIMPQIYFGFECPLDNFKFENCLKNWLSIPRHNTEIYVGLGLYRSGEIVEYGDKKSYEWVENRDIIARQILHLRENNISGFSIFSYSSFEKFPADTENICNLLKGTD